MNMKRKMSIGFLLSLSVAGWIAVGTHWQSPVSAADKPAVDFNRQIAPLLVRRCLGCHNSSEASGELDLSSYQKALTGGESGAAITPGKIGESFLLERVNDGEMPPEEKGKPLTGDEIKLLTAWIKAGAPWPKGRTIHEFEFTTDRRAGRDWWSLQLPVRPKVPHPKNHTWSINPIDAFVLNELEKAGLSPSPIAKKATLIRRAKLDLVGLPPTPEEIHAFVNDQSPLAYEKLIDRYLASPRYGERFGRHWLDVVRFAESNGYETNTPRPNAWPYRDYVIRAFNEDKPYDQFTKEQLAGDVLGAQVATSFLVGGSKDIVGINNLEGKRQQRLDDLNDIISTTGEAFLGLTFGCAKCHNHKFDPVSQTDYYRMYAIFSGVNHGDRKIPSLDLDRNRKDIPALRERIASVSAELGKLDRKLENIQEPIARLVSGNPSDTAPQRSSVISLKNIDRFGPVKAKFVRFTILKTNQSEPCIDELEIFTAGDSPTRNVALAATGVKVTASGEYLSGSSPIHKLVHVNDGQYGNSRSWISKKPGSGWVQVEFAKAETIDRVIWGRDRQGRFKDRLATKYKIEVALTPDQWTVVANSDDRISFDPKQPNTTRKSPDLLSKVEAKLYRRLEQEKKLLSDALPKENVLAYAGLFTPMPDPTYRLHRGEVMQRREIVSPGMPSWFGRKIILPPNATDSDRRLALANWMVDEKNPLTARVMVNRLWRYHFGRGLVTTTSNFGFLGGMPSHPQLLDYLASEFVDRGWSIKQLHRMMMLSATYRQASRIRKKPHAVDAGTRLLWRFPARRLEAEPIRDAVLAVSGTLDLRMGGPGYEVFDQNANYVRVFVPKTKFGPVDWRRMVYQRKPRMEQDSTFGEFDCPDASGPMPDRNVSTTALQALNLLNSPFVNQQAGYFAARLKREHPGKPAEQVRRAFWLAFGRPADQEEVTASVALIKQHGLPIFCRVIFNTSEFIFME